MWKQLIKRVGITSFVLCFGIQVMLAQQSTLGEGFFTPNTKDVAVLYLYDTPNSKAGSQERAIDSITFTKRHGNYVDGIGYAPKGFEPFNEKLDYGIFIMRVKRLGVDYTEIVINESTGTTAYVHTYSGNFMSWGQFMLNCHSVEFIDKNQKVYDHPMVKSAGRIITPAYFKPRYVMGDWMEVEILADDYNTVKGKCWIRWKKDGKLLINYNLFA
ncbi:hypothetical protein G5B37_04655 [Rasiella rasia]|uniref:Uncharacterized protein n=1 Tax=Rasiella rasia TaxID=2744027 RepID=A0A6G6GJW1_9FLAO|nr:hypothetical protein [Rasiella rasia]QIE58876.1 hypothetical protein G5B37_04655 [Rasiella rasia]